MIVGGREVEGGVTRQSPVWQFGCSSILISRRNGYTEGQVTCHLDKVTFPFSVIIIIKWNNGMELLEC
ncbi:unnamed protein product [Onchocerca flexuosa]|uniref:Uncharacterized protein n=1 Tax=Onchocerca flexuosa TaxID=387005 RepID=A0A183HTB9_9BILA|nr:unnamed protein product [Onchocerca flexuosa]